MALDGLNGLYVVRNVGADAKISPADLVFDIGRSALAANTVEVPTKLTSVDFTFMQPDGAVTASGVANRLTTDRVVTTGAVTVTGDGTTAFSYIFIGRVVTQL